jgi:hypothetical protein
MYMSDNWEILEPTKWMRTVIQTECLVVTQTNRVRHQKLNGEIRAYHHKLADKKSEQWKTTSNP